MKKINIAINGFGRIGRVFFRCAFDNPQINIIAINDITDTKTLAHLLKYDSVHRQFKADITFDANHIIVNNNPIKTFACKDPELLPWKELDVDIVIESTGHFLDRESATKHLKAGAKKIILSAPPKDDSIKTIVVGVNDELLSANDIIVSNASCTTNCAAPMLQVLKQWGIEEAYVTTVHSYTGDQRIHDAPHKDLRRARAAALSIIPTSTGAAKALGKIFPELEKLEFPAAFLPEVDEFLASPEIGTPSITYKGSLVPVKEEAPLIFTETFPPGSPELLLTTTPAALPCII